jgi:hypothetical protein
MRSLILLIISAVFVIFAIVWYFFIAPQVNKGKIDINYKAQIDSVDNFYDEGLADYSGKIQSKTEFYFEKIEEKDGISIIKNVFDVRTPDGEPIFSVEREYGIDRDGRHAAGYGDRDRNGYLFAPQGLKKGQNFTYWHINYDGPANMEFQNGDNIFGLDVYRYKTKYENVDIDQTSNLGHLPGVPEERGINLDPVLELWIEPVSGHLVKYKDNTIAYYYDSFTKSRIHPWNNFGNTYLESSIAKQVSIAKSKKQSIQIMQWTPPIVAIIFSAVLSILAMLTRKSKANSGLA